MSFNALKLCFSLCRREDPELILLAGDLYDSWNPPHEGIELLYRTLSRLSDGGRRVIIALAGNHDAPEHVEAPEALAREMGIVFLGYPGSRPADIELESGVKISFPEGGLVRIDGLSSPVRIICTPYANESRMRISLEADKREEALRQVLTERWQTLAENYFRPETVNLMTAHLFMGNRGELLGEEEPEGERSILHPGGLEQIYTDSLPPLCQYMALGHLHRAFPVRKEPIPAVYSGSPCAYSLSESNRDNKVVVLSVLPGEKAAFRFHSLQSPWPVSRQSFRTVEEAAGWLEAHPEGYVEVTMKTADYLTGLEKQRLLKSHPRILAIIPEIQGAADRPEARPKSYSGKSIPEVFQDYYRESHQEKDPPAEIMELLDEILSRRES